MSLRYTQDHEWVRLDGDIATVGITKYAQQQLGDVVFVELPEIGRAVTAGAEMAVVESVKAASDVFAPLGGTISEVNSVLPDAPQTVNDDPEGKAWFVKIKVGDSAEFDALMDETTYQAFVASL